MAHQLAPQGQITKHRLIHIEGHAFVFGLFESMPQPQLAGLGLKAIQQLRMGQHVLPQQRGKMLESTGDGQLDGSRQLARMLIAAGQPALNHRQPIIARVQMRIELLMRFRMHRLLANKRRDLRLQLWIINLRAHLPDRMHKKLFTHRKGGGQGSQPVGHHGQSPNVLATDPLWSEAQATHTQSLGAWGGGRRVHGSSPVSQVI